MSTIHPRTAHDTGPELLMSKLEMTELIMAAKYTANLSWADISAAAEMSEVFVVSACLGQNSLPAATAAKIANFLDFGSRTKAVEISLMTPPKKAQCVEAVSRDPLIYRLFEIIYVYGDTIKALIHEKFGDGIMSAVDFDMAIEKQLASKGDRVKVTMSGKFLPYKQW